MARCFPKTCPEDAPRSEKVVHSALADGLGWDLAVIHGTRVFRPPSGGYRQHEGEIDFLVIHPNRGLLGLEVKGGTVGRDEGGWYSVDRAGTRHEIKDPGYQVQRAMHSLNEFLRGPKHRLKVPWAWGVVLPDVDVQGDLSPALRRELVADRADLENPGRFIERMFEAYTVERTSTPTFLPELLLDALAPSFLLTPTLASRIGEEGAALLRFTEDQTRCLDMLEDQLRVGVRGPAGTGKTLVAMEKARRCAEAGMRTLFLCFNGPLADHLKPLADGFRVSTFHAFAADTVRASGKPWSVPRSAEDSRRFFAEEVPDLLLDALGTLVDERYDAVVVDEGQDFREEWWLAVQELLRDDSSVLYVFHDPEQNIYGGGPVDVLGLSPFRLTENCRNTRSVARHAYGYVQTVPRVREGAPDGQPVRVEEFGDKTEGVDLVRRALHRFVTEERLDPANLVVITTGSTRRGPLNPGTRLGNLELVDVRDTPGPNQVRLSSLHHFKGLEADAAILFVTHSDDRPRHMYVAASRAKHALTVVQPRG